jgi:hypothetical protein
MPHYLQVMKLRRRYDELTSEVTGLVQQRELLLTQISDDKAEWEKLQRVSSGTQGQRLLSCASMDFVSAKHSLAGIAA